MKAIKSIFNGLSAETQYNLSFLLCGLFFIAYGVAFVGLVAAAALLIHPAVGVITFCALFAATCYYVER